ncbi:MAG: LysM peptidoglycan-binding domain-containing protein [Candidatus Pacebacteria bacterium]|nr:LysM peptidoglycan-binding domain-containing protein [Candidatus Paceibacterota bacterium]
MRERRVICLFFLFLGLLGILFVIKGSKTSNTSISRLQSNFINIEASFQPIANNIIMEQGKVISAISSPLFVSSQTLGSLFDDEISSSEEKYIIKHTVAKGESLSGIAEKYNISVETILLANELVSNNIQPGQELLILPINGILHMVEKGETIDTIAKKYSANKDEVIEYNALDVSGDIYIGDVVIIPNGKTPKVVKTTPAATPTYAQVVLPNSYLIVPTIGIVSQGAHYSYTNSGKAYYTAIDISNQIGTPVVAAAGGQVQIMKNKWPYGNYVTILHSNGVVTLYAHLSFFSRELVPGANVSQGQVIGYMGNTGRVVKANGGIGSHLHFETRGASNPLTKFGRGSAISY